MSAPASNTPDIDPRLRDGVVSATAAPSIPRGEITRVLGAVARGESGASEELLPLVYEDLRQHAAFRMARESAQQTLQPTALVHEAWLRLVGRDHPWENRGHFFSAAAEAMRRILIENARRKARLKHGGGQERVDLDHAHLASSTPEEKVILIDEALSQLERQDPEKARVVILKFFGGHSNQDVAELLGLSERTIERHWAYAKALLFQLIREQA